MTELDRWIIIGGMLALFALFFGTFIATQSILPRRRAGIALRAFAAKKNLSINKNPTPVFTDAFDHLFPYILHNRKAFRGATDLVVHDGIQIFLNANKNFQRTPGFGPGLFFLFETPALAGDNSLARIAPVEQGMMRFITGNAIKRLLTMTSVKSGLPEIDAHYVLFTANEAEMQEIVRRIHGQLESIAALVPAYPIRYNFGMMVSHGWTMIHVDLRLVPQIEIFYPLIESTYSALK